MSTEPLTAADYVWAIVTALAWITSLVMGLLAKAANRDK